MICEQCGEEIEDKEAYAITLLGDTIHEECEDDYWLNLQRQTTYYVRDIEAEKWAEKEDMEREI